MTVIADFRALTHHQSQVGFMDQGSGLQRVIIPDPSACYCASVAPILTPGSDRVEANGPATATAGTDLSSQGFDVSAAGLIVFSAFGP